VTARHSVRQQTQQTVAGVLGITAAIFSGSRAISDLANIGGAAMIRGYGREMELEADRLGAGYMAKVGYDPQSVIKMLSVLKNQELFEMDRAKAEGREPQIYHGVFSTHPSADQRLQQAVAVAGSPFIKEGEGHGKIGRDEYLKRIDGMPFGTSRQQGIIRENRFYHADLNLTMAFPKDWTVLNQPTRLLALTKTKDQMIQFVSDKQPDKLTPKEYLEKELRGRTLHMGAPFDSNGMKGYTVVTKSGSPLDGGSGPVRYVALYRDKSVYVFACASRSSQDGVPAGDRIFLSMAQTLRPLKASEFPLAEPYVIRTITADANTRMADLAKESPLTKYAEAQLRLINDLYPKKEPKAGDPVKIIE
jgi:predicted Zn-dependent protease